MQQRLVQRAWAFDVDRTTPLLRYPAALERAPDVALRVAEADAHEQLDDVAEIAARELSTTGTSRGDGRRAPPPTCRSDRRRTARRPPRRRPAPPRRRARARSARGRALAARCAARAPARARRSSPARSRAGGSRTAAGSRRSRRRRPGSRTGGTGSGERALGIEPHRAALGLAELACRRLREQERPASARGRRARGLADQVDAGGDVAPLVGCRPSGARRRSARAGGGSRWPAAACS